MNLSPSGGDKPSPGGKLALVTGASSGIGLVYARRLAEQGCDLILVARREDRLREVGKELMARHSVQAEVQVADLAKPEGIQRVAARIAELPGLDFLVNGAGFGTMGNFVNIDPCRSLEMVYVHVVAPMQLCRAALPGMIARGRGTIVNISSLAAFLSYPGGTNYAATKAYLNSFSQSLQLELYGTGVRVQALCPGFTRTGFHDTQEFKNFDRSQISERLWMSAEDVVEASLRGLRSGSVVCIPGLKNKIMRRLISLRFVRLLAGKRLWKKPKKQ
jgi:hypothetical protein